MWKLSKIFYRVSLNSEVKVNLLKQLLTSSLQQYTCQLLCLRAWASGLQIKEYSILHQLLHADLLERKKLSHNNLDWHISKNIQILQNSKQCKKESMWMILLSQKFPILEQKSLELRTLWNVFGNLMLSSPVQKILVLKEILLIF